MKRISKEDIKDLFIKKYNLGKDKDILDNLINELYDNSKKSVMPLNELETFVFRKRYGISNNGLPTTKEAIAKDYNIGYQKVQRLFNSSLAKLSYRINVLDKRIKINRFSTFYLEKNADIIIDDLKINKEAVANLKNKGIFTLSDLLEIGRIELKTIVGSTKTIEIVSYVHGLGYKFIDELNIEEKKNIMSKYSTELINNSSIYFLDSVKKMDYETLKELNVNTIKDIIEKRELLPRTDKMLLSKEIIEMGFKIPSVKDYSLEALLDLDIAILKLNKTTYDILKTNKINKVKDLVALRKDDISLIPFMNTRKINEIINKVHVLGLMFSSEAMKIEEYSKEINKDLKNK